MPQILGRRRQRAEQVKSEQLGSIAKAAIALSPPIQGKRDFARPADLQAWARTTAATVAPSAGITPVEIEAALVAEGMEWQSAFSPGPPQEPFYGYGRQPRGIDYTPGRNVAITPRVNRIPFGTLEKVISGYDVALICVRHIISDMTSMKIMVQPMDGIEDDVSKEVDAARAFLRKPDGKHHFSGWLARWQQDVLRFDAGALYKQRDNAGNVIGLKVVSGPTISPLMDYFGERPDPPAPAYLQVIEGIPWDWLTEDDLIYEPFTPLPEDVYGLSPIECVLLNANLDVRFQWHFLQKFTDGTVPEGFAEAPPDQSSPDQIEEWQETWDAWMAGDQAQLHRIRWVPANTKFTPTKETAFTEDFPEYMMRRTVAAFGVTPADLGFTSDINRATSDTQMDVQFRISTEPRTGHVENILDDVLQNDLGLRVQVRFDTGREKEDRLMEAQAHQIWISCAVESPDEPRQNVLGLEVDKENPAPRGFLSERLGFMPLEYAFSVGGDIDPSTGSPVPGSVTPTKFVIPGNMAPDPNASPEDQATAAEMLTQATPNTGSNAIDDEIPRLPNGKEAPHTREDRGTVKQAETPDGVPVSEIVKGATAGITSDSGISGEDLLADHVAGEPEALARILRQWKDNSKARIKKGQSPRLFEDVPDAIAKSVWPTLAKATTREQVDAAFELVKAADADPKSPTDHERLNIALTTHFAALLKPLLSKLYPNAAQAARTLAPKYTAKAPQRTGEHTAPGAALAASLYPDPAVMTSLKDVLTTLYVLAYLAGIRSGTEQVPGTPVSPVLTQAAAAVDWSAPSITPDLQAEVIARAPHGLADLIAQANRALAEIADTQAKRMGEVLTIALKNGVSIDTIAYAVENVATVGNHAEMVASTEAAKAQTAGTLDIYALAGMAEFNWVTDTNPCPACQAMEDDNPHTFQEPRPPLHPWCRCSTTPVPELLADAAEYMHYMASGGAS